MTGFGGRFTACGFAFSALLFAAALPRAARAVDGQSSNPDLAVYCDPAAVRAAGPVSQRARYCQAAQATEDGRFANDNNARTWASVTLVCGYTCVLSLSGVPTSERVCNSAQIQGNQKDDESARQISSNLPRYAPPDPASSAAGGDPCGSAWRAGYHGYDDYKESKNDRAASDGNLDRVAELLGRGATATGQASGKPVEAPGASPSVLNGACAHARKSGSADDRLGCTLSTDPAFPAFVNDPRFKAEFLEITGHSLDEQLNHTFSENLVLTSSVLSATYDRVKDKMSLAEFMRQIALRGFDLISSLPKEDRAAFIAELVPGELRNLLPKEWLGGSPGATRPPAAVAAAKGAPEERPASPGDGGVRSLASGESGARSSDLPDEENPRLSLFERVSRTYRRSLDRVAKLDWTLPKNR